MKIYSIWVQEKKTLMFVPGPSSSFYRPDLEVGGVYVVIAAAGGGQQAAGHQQAQSFHPLYRTQQQQ